MQREYKKINIRKSRQIMVGDVAVGGGAKISVQTMTNTKTTDTQSTIAQINRCIEAGAELIRVSVPDQESSTCLKQIVASCSVPIIADIHFHYKRAIESAKAGAKCLRINPGNIGSADKIKEVVKAAKDNENGRAHD
jgi:(E)-4-hydroxy-3-methylbut-2-enyl-diphosphate synthase